MLGSTLQVAMLTQVHVHDHHCTSFQHHFYSINLYLADGPIVATSAFHLLSHDHHYPPTFTLTCTTMAFPPTTLTWTLNGSSLDLSTNNSFSSAQQLRDARSSTYDNILTVSGAEVGDYNCSVSNDRGARSANITVKGRIF